MGVKLRGANTGSVYDDKGNRRVVNLLVGNARQEVCTMTQRMGRQHQARMAPREPESQSGCSLLWLLTLSQ